MADLLTIGSSGIRTYQRSLATVSNNIVNVDTDGYSRQEHETAQDIGSTIGRVNIGSGVLSETIKRAYDSFSTGALRNSTALLEQQDTLYMYARKLENIIGDQNLSLTSATDRFFAAAQGVVASPSSPTARESLLNEARAVAERFKSLTSQFDQLDIDSFSEIESRTQSLNTLAKQLAIVNKSLLKQTDVDSQPNGLLDQRDLLLQEMSELTQIGVKERANGMVDVYLTDASSGNPLVVGMDTTALSVQRQESDPEKVIFILDPYGSPKSVSTLVGGKIAGVESFRNNTLKSIRDDLDSIAVAFVNAVNEVHASGIDATGGAGRAMFGIADGTGREAGRLQVLLTGADDVATASPLQVNQNGSASTLKLESWGGEATTTLKSGEVSILDELDEGAEVTYSDTDAPAFVIQGNQTRDLLLELDVTGGANVEIFTRSGVHVFGTGTADPEDILTDYSRGFDANAAYNSDYRIEDGDAAGESYMGAFTVTDNGDGTYSLQMGGQIGQDLLVFVRDNDATISGSWYEPKQEVADARYPDGVEISFTSATEYSITDRDTGTFIESHTYAAGDTISFNGWVASLENAPQAGDQFFVQTNTAVQGDNRNMIALAALQNDRSIFQGRGTFGEIYANTVNNLGSVVVQASISRDAQQVLTDEAKATRDGVSAVSLDEEAANLLRFQQAYQASAQIIQAANKLFDSILALQN